MRARGQCTEGGEHRRDLAKRQQSRDVGKLDRHAGNRLIHQLQSRERKHGDRRAGLSALESDIESRNQFDRVEAIFSNDVLREFPLQRNRLFRREVP